MRRLWKRFVAITLVIAMVALIGSEAQAEAAGGDGVLGMTQLDMGDVRSANASNGDPIVSQIFPTDIEASMGALPIEVTKKSHEDGTYEIRVAVGIMSKEILENGWADFKTKIKDAKKAQNKIEELKRLQSILGGAAPKVAFIPELNFDVGVKGFWEGQYDKDGNYLSADGGVIIGGEVSATFTWYFAACIIPIYLDLSGGAQMEIVLGFKSVPGNEKLYPDGAVTVTPYISVGGGVGVKSLLSVGAEGKASLGMQFYPSMSGSFTAQAFIRATALFIIDKRWEIAQYTKQLWSKNQKLNAKEKEFQLARYQSKLSKSKGANDEGLLQSSIPKRSKCGSDDIVIYQNYVSGRGDANTSGIYYKVNQGDPILLDKAKGTNAYFANLYKDGSDLYMVYMRGKEAVDITEEMKIDEIMNKMYSGCEIAVSKYDETSHTFGDGVVVSQEDTSLDMMPQLTKVDNKLTAVWIKNHENDPFGEEESENHVTYSQLDGTSWTAEKTLFTTKDAVTEMQVYDGNQQAESVSGSDLEVALVANNKLQIASDDKTVSDVVSDSSSKRVEGVQVIDNKLKWIEDSDLQLYNTTKDVGTDMTVDNDTNVTGSVRHFTDGTRHSLIWVRPNAKGSSLMSSVKRSDGVYSKPIEIYNSTKEIQNFDGYLDETGYHFVLNEYDAYDAVKDEGVMDLTHELATVDLPVKKDVAINGITADESTRTAEGAQAIQYTLKNQGEEKLQKAHITIQANGVKYLDKDVTVNLEPGESCELTDTLQVFDIVKETSFSASVTTDDDSDDSNNEFTFKLGKSDLSVSVAKTVGKDSITLTSTITNQSYIPAAGALNIHAGVDYNTKVASTAFESIPAKGSKTVQTVIKKSKVQMATPNYACYQAEVDCSSSEYNTENNKAFCLITKLEAKVSATKKKVTKPAKPVIKSVKNSKKRKLVLTLKKKISGAKGYQVFMATNKKFTKGKRKVLFTKLSAKKSMTVKKCKKKTYYVKVRAYKISGKKKVYGAYSKIKKCKIRR